MRKLSFGAGIIFILTCAMGCGDDEKHCTPDPSASAETGGLKAGGGGSLVGVSNTSPEVCTEDNSSGANTGNTGSVGVVGNSGANTGSSGAGESESNAGEGCGNISFEGQCQGSTLIWCEGDQLYQADCAEISYECGYKDAQTGYDCVDGSSSGDLSDDEFWGDDEYWDEEWDD
jgi:hypothetical protein